LTRKILTVDDKLDVTITIKHGLEKIDPEIVVQAVTSGAKCFEFLENEETPDLILLDIMMPDMTGWEVLKKLKSHDDWKKIPVIFLTARTDQAAIQAGSFLADDYIEKPFQIQDLYNRIDNILK